MRQVHAADSISQPSSLNNYTMSKPIGYNIPQGVNEGAFLSDDLLVMLGDVFVGVTDAFGDDAKLYKIDIGKIIESVQAGGMVFSGQFVDKSDGEIFNFEINQETNQLGYKSSGEFLDRQSLAAFCDRSSTEEAEEDSSEDQSEQEGLRPYSLLLDAINDEASEAGQSPFGSKLRKDLDYLAALSAAMYQGAIRIEAQPLYAGLHSYAIKYALSGLQLFTQSIGSVEGLESELMAEQWVDEHGLDFASAVVKEFSSRRCERMRELIQAGDQTALEEIKGIVEEAIAMAMSCTVDLIKTVAEADDYKPGDVQVALVAAIEEYCPIDNSDGYHVSENPRNMASEWQQVTDHSGCSEDLSMEALGLPVAEHMLANSDQGSAEKLSDCPTTEHVNGEAEDAERIFYVNVGEGPSRNWDDCRQFGFLAAGGGRKWSKQLEKIKIGDTVIAYLKGYGYVGIGKVTSTSTPATKFVVNGVLIKELPLINDTIRSIKRFSKENGEYLIGVAWQVAVPREQAAWKANAGLFTTALVCASLSNQPTTVSFALRSLSQVTSGDSMLAGDEDDEPSMREVALTTLVPYMNGSSYYNPNDYGWDILEAFSFPPGRYFLGDPAHALTGDQYREACDISYNSCGDIEGVGEIAIFKCPGDGQYVDENDCTYSVGSGTLGIVPIGHLSLAELPKLNKLGKVLEVPGDAGNPNWEDDGEGLQAMIDSQGHIFLGSGWIFCGDEHPLQAEFWKYLADNNLDDCDFWPSEVTKVLQGENVVYFGRCENAREQKCFIIEPSLNPSGLNLAPARPHDSHDKRIPGYPNADFEEKWIELAHIQGMTVSI